MKRATSFFHPRDRVDSGSSESSKWDYCSPTQHVFQQHQQHQHRVASCATPSPATIRHLLEPAQLPKRRSRSFGDYVDAYRRDDAHERTANDRFRTYHLALPELKPKSGESHDVDENGNNDYGNFALDDSQLDRSESSSTKSIPKRTEKDALNSAQFQGNDTRQGSGNGPIVDDVDNSTDNNNNSDSDTNPFYVSVLYGLINATIVLPVVMSFGNIIYRDDAFREYMPVLIKLTLVSGFVHQLCFSSLSSLKFAVGSVQDAGLIFLSSMAKDMADFCHRSGYDDPTMLATVTVGLGIAATILGVGLVIIARLRLAGYVQMLPTCVVAGYLAYIGYFVGYSGLGIMAGQSSLTVTVLLEQWLYVIPGVLGGCFIYISVQRLRHVSVLPICISLLLAGFYVTLALCGSSIEQATINGWIRKAEQSPSWLHTWDYIKLDHVAWEAIPQLWMTELAMLLVVALSSSLDVAAIELEMKRPLDYNKELTMVGVSNVVSGMTFGYTGSYIFSQSIFSLRIGIRSRVAGFALAFFQLLVIVIPFPILSFVPNFFYGSLLSMICIDLMYEWLWDFRGKSTVAEYVLALSTFCFIFFLGVEYGILAGVVLYCLCRQFKINVGELKQIQPLEDAGQERSIHENQNLGKNNFSIEEERKVGTTKTSNGSETECLLQVLEGTDTKSYQATNP